MKQPTKEDIDNLQDITGEGRMWCKREIQQRHALEAVMDIPATGNEEFDREIKQILEYLVRFK